MSGWRKRSNHQWELSIRHVGLVRWSGLRAWAVPCCSILEAEQSDAKEAWTVAVAKNLNPSQQSLGEEVIFHPRVESWRVLFCFSPLFSFPNIHFSSKFAVKNMKSNCNSEFQSFKGKMETKCNPCCKNLCRDLSDDYVISYWPQCWSFPEMDSLGFTCTLLLSVFTIYGAIGLCSWCAAQPVWLWSRHKDVVISIMSFMTVGVNAAFSHLVLPKTKVLFAWLISKVKSVFRGETPKAVCLLNKSLDRITSQQHHLGFGPRL